MMISRLLTRVFIISTMVAFSFGAAAEHSWGGYHWARTSNPFTLLVVDSTTGDWFVELDAVLTAWSEPTPPPGINWPDVLDLIITATDSSKKTRRRCRMVNGQIRVCNDTYGNNGWLGLATIGINSVGHIDRGTAKLNDTYSSYWQDQEKRNHVMCQEVGHLLGLDHTSVNGLSQKTCMDYSWDPLSQWPNVDDYIFLAEIYAHIDLYNSFDIGDAPDGDSGVCNAPRGKGCNKNNKNNAVAEIPPMGIRISQGKNSEIWVAPRNDGGLWIHHIRLVPED